MSALNRIKRNMRASQAKNLGRAYGAPIDDPKAERLVSAAIVRDGQTHAGAKSHYEIRSRLGDEFPNTRNLDDEEGFMTSAGRFVDREEAKIVAEEAGQIRPGMQRELLSSDINWDK